MDFGIDSPSTPWDASEGDRKGSLVLPAETPAKAEAKRRGSGSRRKDKPNVQEAPEAPDALVSTADTLPEELKKPRIKKKVKKTVSRSVLGDTVLPGESAASPLLTQESFYSENDGSEKGADWPARNASEWDSTSEIPVDSQMSQPSQKGRTSKKSSHSLSSGRARTLTQATQTEPWNGVAAQREDSYASSAGSLVTLAPILELTDEAEHRANLLFQRLRKDLSPEGMLKMTQDTSKLALSRDRVAIMLERSKGYRLTCSQMKVMMESVSLDTHKKNVIYERYAQLSDKHCFVEEIVHNFTRSSSLRGVVMKDLSKHLEGLEFEGPSLARPESNPDEHKLNNRDSNPAKVVDRE